MTRLTRADLERAIAEKDRETIEQWHQQMHEDWLKLRAVVEPAFRAYAQAIAKALRSSAVRSLLKAVREQQARKDHTALSVRQSALLARRSRHTGPSPDRLDGRDRY